MIKELFHSIFPCKFESIDCKDNVLGCKCGKGGKQPSAPAYQMPSWASELPEEQLALIRSQVGKQAGMPGEFDMASQALQGLLGYTPEQFQFPMEQIQQALTAQQGLQQEDYLKQIRPILAQQGQLDSSYYTNLVSDFLKGQQAQTYGTTADLLTQQALKNLELQQYIPQLQLSAASGLGGIGGQRSGIEQFNLQLPFQTTIPAFGNVYGQGLNLGDRNTQQANMQYQADLESYKQKEAQKQQLYQQLGQLGLAAATGGMSGGLGMLGAGKGFGGGALQGLMGTAGQSQLMNQFMGGGMGGGGMSSFGNFYGQNTPFGTQDMGNFSTVGGGSRYRPSWKW